MAEGAGRARLLLEAAQAVGARGHVVVEDLEGDVTAEARIAGSIHLAHASRAQRSQDLVGPELLARGEAHALSLQPL